MLSRKTEATDQETEAVSQETRAAFIGEHEVKVKFIRRLGRLEGYAFQASTVTKLVADEQVERLL